VVDRQRAGGEERIEQLAPAVREAPQVAPGLGVPELELDLLDAQAGPRRVDRHPHLAPESTRRREASFARLGGQVPLARQWLAGDETGAETDQIACRSLRDAESSAARPGEGRDREVGVGLGQRPNVTCEVRVCEHDRSGRSGDLGQGQGLPLPAPRELQDAGPGALGLSGGCIA
jgi:hypothetical protein